MRPGWESNQVFLSAGRSDQEVIMEKYNLILTCFGIDKKIRRIGVKYNKLCE